MDFRDANNGLVMGNNYPCVGRTTDGGATWNLHTTDTLFTYTSVSFSGDKTGYAVGLYNVVMKTTDGGLHWVEKSFPGGVVDLCSVFAVSADTCWIAGDNRTLMKTTDGGTTWVSQNTGNLDSYLSLFFTDASTGYATGKNGLIRRTTNGGAQWVTEDSPTCNDLYAVCFTSVETGYAAGSNGAILNTTTGGMPPATLAVTPPDRAIPATAGSAVFFVSSNTLWSASSNVSWCSVTQGGSFNDTIVASCSENLTSAPRVATITVRAGGTDSVMVTVTQAKSNLGIGILSNDGIQIWPNPGKGLFTIRIPECFRGETEISVHDLNGNCLFRKTFGLSENIVLDLSTVVPGVYPLILKSKNLAVVRKLVIIR